MSMMSNSRIAAICHVAALCFLIEPESSSWAGECSAGTGDCNLNGIPDGCDVLPRTFGFTSAGSLAVGALADNTSTLEYPGSLVAVDIDGDAALDLATANYASASLSILWGRGDGTFLDKEDHGVGGFPQALAVGDFDGDVDLDLAVNNVFPNTITILWNQGMRRLGTTTTIEVPTRPQAPIAADLDGDRDLDLAVAHTKGVYPDSITRVVPLLNDGRGAFVPGKAVELTPWGLRMAAADFDRDGDPDLATVSSRGFNEFLIALWNNGDATFSRGESIALPETPVVLLPADMSGDGLVDLLGGSSVLEPLVIRNRGDGGFQPFRRSDANRLFPAAIGDLDEDGDIDLGTISVIQDFTRRKIDSSFRALLNDGNGVFVEGFQLATEHAEELLDAKAADLDGDGDLDIAGAFGGHPRGSVAVYRNEPVPLSLDCDSNGVPDECDAALDCSGNGIPGACEPDCNSNGIADDCDVANGASQDCDFDDIPDECGLEPVITLGFRAPRRVGGRAGTAANVPVRVELGMCGFDASGPAVQGWFLQITLTNAMPADATTAGTRAAPYPEGLRNNGFEQTAVSASTGCGETLFSGVLLSFTEPVTLGPEGSPHEILRFTLESSFPESGIRTCGIEFRNFCGYPRSQVVGDGGGADHPVETYVIVDGDPVIPALDSKRLELLASAATFRRGDTNADGRVDISDAIRTFMYLFRGAAEPPCLDAGDTTDDGRIDLSDGIQILHDFFRPGTGITEPGPFYCGTDPTEDSLECEMYEAC